MSFGEAVRSVYSKYATFDGRATRSEYWWFQLFTFLVALCVYGVAIALALITRAYAGIGVAVIGLTIFGLLSLIPSLAVLVRRLHDTDRSGWWILIAFIPWIGAIILFVFLVLPSTDGFNKFGPPPFARPGDHLAQYFGPSRSEALQKFATDAQQAAAAGYQPIAQYWKAIGGGEVLEVVYRHQSMEPPWQSPGGGQAPGGFSQAPPTGQGQMPGV
jgi:uncharacterized membrane protein YhaH (DUF805 family)